MASTHLICVCHGLWGAPQHITYIGESALKHATAKGFNPSSRSRSAPSGREVKLVVLEPKGNAVDWTYGYDSIPLCADRVVEEIDHECERIRKEGGKVDRFSIVGYSLGGLIARYTIGLLDSRQPSFFQDVEPVNFATFATPHIGIPHYRSFWSSVFRYLGARLLSRTGEQLYEKDRFLPSRFNPYRSASPQSAPNGSSTPNDTNSSEGGKKRFSKILPFIAKGQEEAEPLLKVMADPRYSFYRALRKFERIEVYANTVNDRTVPFITGSFEAHDPFALARAKAQKVAEKRGDDPEKVTDYTEGELKITLRKDAPIVDTYTYIPPPPSTSLKPTQPPTLWKKLTRRLPRLPMLLRPSSYPVSRPKAWVVVLSLPLTLPIFVTFLIVRFSLQGRQSRKRINEARKKRGEGVEGMLQRVGVRMAEVVEVAGVENPEYAGGLDTPIDREGEGVRSAVTSGVATPVEGATAAARGSEATLFGQGDGGATKLDGKDFPSISSSTTTSTTSSASLSSSASLPSPPPPPPRQSPLPHPPSSDLTLATALKTDPLLTPSQTFQLTHLNALPQLRKHFVHMPEVRHSHGVIVRRDPNFWAAKMGKQVVDHWAKEFRL